MLGLQCPRPSHAPRGTMPAVVWSSFRASTNSGLPGHCCFRATLFSYQWDLITPVASPLMRRCCAGDPQLCRNQSLAATSKSLRVIRSLAAF